LLLLPPSGCVTQLPDYQITQLLNYLGKVKFMNQGSSRGAAARVAIIAILFLTFASVMLDRMASLYLGPYLVDALHLSAKEIGLLASVTGICWALSSLFLGALSDRVGRRPVLIPAVFTFAVCSWLSGTAHSFHQLLLYRALLGFAEGPCWSVVMALTEESSPPEHRGRNIGIVNSAGPLAGAAIAPVFTTQMARAFGWQWGFYGAGIPALLCAVLLLLFVREPKHRLASSKSDVPGFGDFTRLIRHGNLWLCLLGALGVSTWVFGFTTFAPLYITKIMHQTPTLAGFLLGASGLGGFAWSFFGTSIADHLGRKKTLSLFALLFFFMPVAFMAPGLYRVPWVLAGLALLLMTTSASAALVMILIPAECVPRQFVAAAIGFAGIGSEFLGATVAPIIGGALADAYGLSAPMFLAMGGALLVLFVSLVIRETLVRTQPGHPAAVMEMTSGK
jgi:predicted MFS family arabinose efflux permease